MNLPKTIDFGGGTQSDVTWKSSDEKTAKIDKDGNLVPIGEGKVTLTANSKTDPSKKITITITIAKKVTAIRTPIKTLYVKKGRAITPPVAFDGKDAKGKAWGYNQKAKLEWSSANKKIATVNKTTGKISPKKKGTTYVTAKALNNKTIKFKVVVVTKAKKLSKIAFTKPPKSLKKGKSKALKIKLTPAKATNVVPKFKSNKTSVLKVDKAGKLYAVKKGNAKITVSVGAEKKIITVKVK